MGDGKATSETFFVGEEWGAIRYWVGRIWLLGVVLGGYLWEFLGTNLDYTGPQDLSLVTGLLFALLIGPAFLLSSWALTSLLVSRGLGVSWGEALRCDAPSYLPVGLFVLSPVAYLVTRRHTPSYQAAVVVLVSSVVSSVAALKVWWVGQLATARHPLPSRQSLPYRRIIYLAVAFYIVLFSTLALLRYASYHYWLVDLGLNDQALWNTTQGRFLEHTFYEGIQTNFLADHVEPIFLLLLPFYWLGAGPRFLLVVRIVVTALVALPLYALAEEILRSKFAATCVALAYLVFPLVVDSGLHGGGNIRTDVFALLFLMCALYYLQKESWLRFGIFTILAMLCKEHVPLVVAALGLYIVYRFRRFKLGFTLSILGLGYFALAVGWFLPWMRGGEPSRHFALSLSALGGQEGISGIVKTVTADPGLLLSVLLTRPKLDFIFFFLFSLAMLPLFDLALFLVSAPILGLFMLYPGAPNLTDFHFLIPLGFAFAASVGGIRYLAFGSRPRLLRRIPAPGAVGVWSLAALLLSMCLCSGFFWGPGPLSWGFWAPSRPHTYWKGLYTVDDHARRADRFVAMVPDEEPVLVSDYLEIRLTHRERIYTLFAPPADATLAQVNYALVDLFENHIRNEESAIREKALLRGLLAEFNLAASEDGLLYFERYGEAGFYNAVDVVASIEPQHRLAVDFGDRVRLLGYDLSAFPSDLQRGQRYRIIYYWQVLEGFDSAFSLQHTNDPAGDEQLYADWTLIDTFSSGAKQFRVIHLPTYLLLPPDRWLPGQVVRESYDFELPKDLTLGEYSWDVGLYAVPAWFAIDTDPGRLVPGTEPFHLARTRVW